MQSISYIANQVTPEGLDEVQRIVLAHSLGQHVALAGPPGQGKTELVTSLETLLRRPLSEITCDEYMTDAALVGAPELASANGSTVTRWTTTIATTAAEQGGILYLDEVDRLSGSMQKRLNSLFDDRRRITRRDGTVIPAADGFMTVLSYNPSDKLSHRELEESVADRFVHLYLDYLPSPLEAALALRNTEALQLEKRAIAYDPKTKLPKLFRHNGSRWNSFLPPIVPVELTDEVTTYSVFHKPEKARETPPRSLTQKEFAHALTRFFTVVRSFADHGTTALEQEIKTYLRDIGEITRVPLHKPSLRIAKAALDQYTFLVREGMEPQYAQAYASRVVIDQICYGKFGLKPLGSITTRDAVTSLAQFHNLIGSAAARTDF